MRSMIQMSQSEEASAFAGAVVGGTIGWWLSRK